MDNLCHTLVGAAIGEAGLKRKTRLANPTLMIAANLPDLDALVFATGMPSLAFRRGWTHGLLAQLVLPMLLTAAVVWWSRARAARGAATGQDAAPLSVPWLLALSYIGVYSHVFLDYLNNYGIRLLAPIDWRWFYGDTLFIVDVWLWAALGAGVWLTRRTGRPLPARGGLAFAACYVLLMLSSARAARPIVHEAWRTGRGIDPQVLMVGPVPLSPFRRTVIVDAGDHYETGTFSWPATVTYAPRLVAKNRDAPGVADARRAPRIRAFLVWARFPYWDVQQVPDGWRVTVKDMRFGDRFSAEAVVPAETVRTRPDSSDGAAVRRRIWTDASRNAAAGASPDS